MSCNVNVETGLLSELVVDLVVSLLSLARMNKISGFEGFIEHFSISGLFGKIFFLSILHCNFCARIDSINNAEKL